MTTKAAEALYEAQHVHFYEGRRAAIFNPSAKSITELPIIYGFNNGGPRYFLDAVLIAEDGTYLGGHRCSSEAYMPSDLGILEGTREDRHEEFRTHYPDGYRMEFVSFEDATKHPGLQEALKSYAAKKEKEKEKEVK